MSDVKEAAGANAAAPAIRCFNGINSAQQKQVSGISFTPDCNGAVNDTYFVEFINNAFSVYDKQPAPWSATVPATRTSGRPPESIPR